jgi:glycosyltransferase involved in cell wall biosynthesis
VKSATLAHDWIIGFRGGERVFEAITDLFPSAPIYTLFHKPGSGGKLIEGHPIHTSDLNRLPGAWRHYPKLLPLLPGAVDRMKIADPADLMISSSHCVIKGLKKPAGAVHVSYVHSPMRYMYDQFDSYFGPGAPIYQRIGGRVFRGHLTKWDLKSNENVDHFIANSAFVQSRIKKFYGRDSIVIHPFVETDDFRAVQTSPPPKEDYFLMVGALTPNKRVDLAIEAFQGRKDRLKIIGTGHFEKLLRKRLSPNIEFLGQQTRATIVDSLAKARALIFPGVEDFGITPLESLAAGTPVVAYRAGGALETLTPDTAVFFDSPDVAALGKALDQLGKTTFERRDLYERAAQFSRSRFLQKMKDYLAGVGPVK